MLRSPSRIPGSVASPLILALGTLVLLAAPALAPPALAQSLWMPRDHDHAVLVEALKPNFDGIDEDFVTLAAFIGGRNATRSLAFVWEASLARFGYSDSVSSINSFELGNAYLGVEKDLSPNFFAELGGRLPISSNSELEAQLTGVLSDVNRWEAFLGKAATIQAAINAGKVLPSHFFYRLRLSPAFVIPIGNENPLADPELFAVYSGQVGMELPSVRMGVALVARTLVTEPDFTFSERSTTQADAHVDFGGGRFRPGIDMKASLDSDVNDDVPFVIGISLGFSY